MVIEHVRTELMIINPLTKGMPLKNFKEHLANIGNWFHFVTIIIFSLIKLLFKFSHFVVHIFIYFEKFCLTQNKQMVYSL